MNNLVVLPILLPLITGVIALLFFRRISIQRVVSVVGLLLTAAASIMLITQVAQSGIQTLNMGGWEPPYGIVLVADMVSALLVVAASIIALACLLYAFRSVNKEREEHHFYPFFLFLIAGVNGSFLTGDLFNLFVCFELMLISSYALIVLGGTERQLRETIKYVLINIVSSALFVASIGFLYSVTGTLNMADLSNRIAEVGQSGVITLIAVLFLIVFSIKAGLFLFFWLSGSYAAPPAVVTALFAGLLTKVGLYAIVRTFTLIFYHDPDFFHALIGWMAGATMVLGVIGAISYRDVNKILIYNVIAGVGFVAFGMAAASRPALEGLLFYMLHDMLIKTLLFLLGGALIAVAGTSKLDNMGGLIHRYPLLGWMFFISALALAGIPPFSGFPGKLLLFEGGLQAGLYGLTGIAVLSSLLMLYSVLRIFIQAFWGEPPTGAVRRPYAVNGLLIPAGILFVFIIAMGVGAEGMFQLTSRAGDILLHPNVYIDAVLKE
ncbi:multisubunit sodium/proton antiporter MrpD subunit [Paenibacillus pabuli]|uniref:Multisubunit sodium/proton antiporter MrpD subunit n=1 Tax=Paenibacillus pabuli TaxID=1472 RepID=A0ABX9BPU1_9BACL|nr:Na+/H+ antiporter subunit D [Paenibacillus pabuli]RAJ00733.1 multisubunit sodium/proton antiporter MrpD subunit [Paenibacillus pabuli]